MYISQNDQECQCGVRKFLNVENLCVAYIVCKKRYVYPISQNAQECQCGVRKFLNVDNLYVAYIVCKKRYVYPMPHNVFFCKLFNFHKSMML